MTYILLQQPSLSYLPQVSQNYHTKSSSRPPIRKALLGNFTKIFLGKERGRQNVRFAKQYF